MKGWTVYLMRHGEAAWTTPDSERALTPRGIDQTRQMIKQLHQLKNVQRILCSPFQRARQTAAEAESTLGLSATRHDCLTPDEPVRETLEALDPYVANGTLIVAHQPLLGNLVSLLTTGGLAEPHPFTTSEIVELEVDAWAPGCSRLVRNFYP